MGDASEEAKEYFHLPVSAIADNCVHGYLHVRKHQKSATDEDEFDGKRTLFVAGLPLGYGHSQLVALFSTFGKVEQVQVQTIGKANTCHVVFETPQGMKKTLKAAKEQAPASVGIVDKKELPKNGMKKWVAAHRSNAPGHTALEAQMNDWLREHEAAEQQKAEELAAAAQAEADDGWTVVMPKKGRQKTRDGEGGTAVGSISAAKTASIGAQAAEKDAKRKAQLRDFYRFQRREQQRDNLMELRQKFEEDKAKIAKLRDSRRFRPY
mmetsp:Transcript_42556/g.51701  ORF Transcript_42556/g.51701 Transcript_42556/m.51701 type:complete len:266 (-) Transcript_42556:135-932(-)|eukprot:CAMPEP_0197858022 /NCGR_PEP_ID=MMETSP1438-20131217/31516_1 /TAXON_ID=1461541 /ORGANISM="Pterosperma sp., Strain CCMP1384" /LENGTH=265 /DNA_ID=CAMNT_0043474043 /DNA_START=177 /DNA_END=974 /DNA_ORIENTATION=-